MGPPSTSGWPVCAGLGVGCAVGFRRHWCVSVPPLCVLFQWALEPFKRFDWIALTNHAFGEMDIDHAFFLNRPTGISQPWSRAWPSALARRDWSPIHLSWRVSGMAPRLRNPCPTVHKKVMFVFPKKLDLLAQSSVSHVGANPTSLPYNSPQFSELCAVLPRVVWPGRSALGGVVETSAGMATEESCGVCG